MQYIREFCDGNYPELLELLMETLDIPPLARPKIMSRWEEAGRPRITQFAPYATHVFKVDLLYCLGMYRGFIDTVRASNKADMAYLYYLPFCMVFVSGDNLHARTAPLFLNDDQTYVTAKILKASLRQLDEHFDNLPDEVKERGVMSFSAYPPPIDGNMITKLWDKNMRADWREIAKEEDDRLRSSEPPPPSRESVPEIIRNMDQSTPLSGADAQPSSDDVDQVYITKMVPAQRGKWRMVSQEIVDAGEDRNNKHA